MAKAGKGVRTRQYNPGYKTKMGWLGAGELREIRAAAKTGKISDFKHLLSKYTTAGMGARALQEVAKEYSRAIVTRNNPGATNLAQYVMAAMEHTRGAHDEGGRVIHETPKAKRREFAKEIWWRRGFRNPRFSPDKTAAKLVKAYGSVRGAEIAALEEKRMLVGDTKPAGRQQMAHVTAVLNALAGMPHEAVEKFYRKRGGYTNRGSAAKSRNVHLQGMGDYEGTPAGQLKPGMRIYFNYGIVYRVVAVEPAGGKSVLVTMQANDGKLYKKRYVKTREVAASSQQNPGGPARRRNSGASADSAYEMFHGTAPTKTKVLAVPLLDPYDSHSNLWQLGKLKSLTVGEFIEKMAGRDGDDPKSESSSAWATQIDFDENSAPDLAGEPGGRQLYIVGGQQNIERYLNKLRLDPGKNPLDCGFIYRIEYFTRKAFDRNRPVNYWHHFGEETGVQPRLIYDRTNHRLQLAGGEYVVKREGIVN